jgi:hypothetical protein
MRDVLMALPTSFGFSMGHEGPAFCPTVKSIYPDLGGYRLLQDQSRPEYGVLYTDQRVATVELGVVKDLPAVSYMTQFNSPFELLWVKTVPVPDSALSQTSMVSSARNRTNYMVSVASDDLDVINAVFNEQVALNNGVLLRLHGNIRKRDLDGIPVEFIDGSNLEPADGKRAPDLYIVSTASDEVVGKAHNRGDSSDYYSCDIVTADVQLAAMLLAACAKF